MITKKDKNKNIKKQKKLGKKTKKEKKKNLNKNKKKQNKDIKQKEKKTQKTKEKQEKKTLKIRSYSPLINKKLQIHTLKTQKPISLKICDNLLKLNVNTKNNILCKNYDDKIVQKILLYNLKSSKHLDVKKLIAPLQLMSNCWFNTMFVTFFFSDKGRKFFRFFRELMITGKKMDLSPIPSSIAKIFYILNLFIEASYNQNTKSGALLEKINSLTNKLNTNYFIYHIYQIINNKPDSIKPELLINNHASLYDIPNIKDAGNPLRYYESLLKYLKYDTLKLMKQNFTSKLNVQEIIQNKFINITTNVIPDIIILEDFESNSLFKKTYKFIDSNKEEYIYNLDAIILTNKDHFDPKANSHFVSVLTFNKKEYKFDGSSLSTLTEFKWKNMINNNKDWVFKENPKYEPEKYNFTKGYKIMFYYRS